MYSVAWFQAVVCTMAEWNCTLMQGIRGLQMNEKNQQFCVEES